MKLQLVARHLRDDEDIVIEKVDHHANIWSLFDRMKQEIEADKAEGSNWRYSITPTEDTYK